MTSTLCSVLADTHCRQVLDYSRATETDVATLDELVEHAVASDDTTTDRERTAVRFHHVTLPKLADAEVLEYDPRQRDVRFTGDANIEPLLEYVEADDSATN